MEEDPCVPTDRSGGERKHRGEREGREEEGEKAYTIALGGYWIRNRGHTGYRRILLPTLTSLSHPLPLFRNCEPFSRMEDVAAVQSLDWMHYSHDGAKGYRVSRSYLAPPTSAAPLLGADHAVDRIRRRTNLSIHSMYEPGFVLIVNFFLVNRDLMVKRNGWGKRSRFCESFYFLFLFLFLSWILCTILVEGEKGTGDERYTDHGLDYGTRRCGAVVARKTNWRRSKRIEIELSNCTTAAESWYIYIYIKRDD